MSTANMGTGPPHRRGKPRRWVSAGLSTDEENTPSKPSLYRYSDGLRRRRAAADRLPPLASRREPWTYPPPGQRGYEAAALHLLERGLLPAPNCEGLEAMHDRQAAQHIAERWGLVA
jgi:hypothetical protein